MKKGEMNTKKGLTIIEVSLVLAVAGLIFLMVFVALPEMRSAQRDSQRKDDLLVFLEAVKKYQSNNRGALPSNGSLWATFYTNYLGNNFVSPSGEAYTIANIGDIGPCEASGVGLSCSGQLEGSSMAYDALYVFTQATCGGDAGDEAIKSSNPRSIVVLTRLEKAGRYCEST